MTGAGAAIRRRAAAHAVVDDVAAPSLDADTEHHFRRVLRLREGEVVTVTDGAGGWRECVVASSGLEPVGDAAVEPAAGGPITIGVAVPKQDRPEWIVQKLTEVGVGRIVVLHAERSVVRWDDDRAERHLAKLRRVAREALQQSRGVWLPVLDGPVPAAAFLPGAAAAEPGGRPLGVSDRVVAIGPEGGWSDAELDLAADRITLGTTVLRVETAAIAAAVQMVAHQRS